MKLRQLELVRSPVLLLEICKKDSARFSHDRTRGIYIMTSGQEFIEDRCERVLVARFRLGSPQI